MINVIYYCFGAKRVNAPSVMSDWEGKGVWGCSVCGCSVSRVWQGGERCVRMMLRVWMLCQSCLTGRGKGPWFWRQFVSFWWVCFCCWWLTLWKDRGIHGLNSAPYSPFFDYSLCCTYILLLGLYLPSTGLRFCYCLDTVAMMIVRRWMWWHGGIILAATPFVYEKTAVTASHMHPARA